MLILRHPAQYSAGLEIALRLKDAPSPLVTLATRRKEPDFAWAPAGQIIMNGVPAMVLEVAVFNETKEELLEAGREWLDLPTTQVR